MRVATSNPTNCDKLSPAKEQLLTLRMVAFGLSTDLLELLTGLLLGGRMTLNIPHDHWAAVQDYLDGKPQHCAHQQTREATYRQSSYIPEV